MIGKRLKEARKKAGKSQKDVVEAVGITQSALSQLENGLVLSSSHLPSIANFLNVDAYWLQTGEQPTKIKNLSLDDIKIKFGSNKSELIDTNARIGVYEEGDSIPEGFVAIDYYPEIKASAGNGYMNLEESSPYKIFIPTTDVMEFGASPTHSKIFKVDGESMIPDLYPGQKISVDTSAKKIYDGEIYAFLKGNELKVKILFNWGDEGLGGIKAVSRNSDKVRYPDEYYSPAQIESEHIQIIGQYWLKIDGRKVRR